MNDTTSERGMDAETIAILMKLTNEANPLASSRVSENIVRRILAFLLMGSYGRVELDVKNGYVVQCRVTEMVKPSSTIVKLREPGAG